VSYVKSSGGTVVRKPDGYEIFLPGKKRAIHLFLRAKSSDAAVFCQVFIDQEYAPIVELIKSTQAVNVSHIVDAGANVGLASLYFLTCFPDANVLAVEPDRGNHGALCRNFLLNKVDETSALHAALWKNNQPVRIERSFRDQREWSLRVSETGEHQAGSSMVNALTPDDLLQMHTPIDLLKIDIEGAEAEVFSDAQRAVVFLRNVRFVAIEIHREVDFKDTFENILKDAGFIFTYCGESLIGVNKNQLIN
jgi:FkbM family methyltransferase